MACKKRAKLGFFSLHLSVNPYNLPMLAIANRNIAAGLRNHFKGFILEFSAEGISDPHLSGHPSLFFCNTPSGLIVSPDLPPATLDQLAQHEIKFTKGGRHPAGSCYNAVATDKYLIHRLDQTDPSILQNCHYLKKIPVKQGFTRSHLLPLKNDHFITSDIGIEEALREKGMDVLFVSPREILLPGHENGGIGGTAGVLENTVFFHGSLQFHPDGEKIRSYLDNLGFSLIELSGSPLTDSGSFLFLRTEI
jgi:hypothetical protein